MNAVSVTAGGDSVNVKTYHKSKGLEYPFVFLCTLSKKLVREDARTDNVRLHKSQGCAFRLKDTRLNVERKNLYYDHLTDVLVREQKSEKMRLFYVGCTRAKEKLIFVCSNEKTGHLTKDKLLKSLREAVRAATAYNKVPASLTSAQDNMLAWVVMALSKLENSDALADWLQMPLDTVPKVTPEEPLSLTYRVCSYEEDSTQADAAEVKTQCVAADPSIVLKLIEKYKFTHTVDEDMLPAKLTVTEIVTAEKEKQFGDKNPEFFPNLPRLSEELDKLTAAEKGTYTHKFMELADYDKAKVSIRDELERLKNSGRFTEREAKGVYVDRLEKFVITEFFARMMSSPDLRREQKFLASVKDLGLGDKLKEYTTDNGYIQGIADCIFKEDDGWVLVDYKTDNFKSVDDMKKYSTQLMLYKAAFELLLGEKVKSSYIYSFKLGEGLEFDL